MKYLVFLGIFILSISSCKKSEEQTQAEKDDQIINDYLNQNGLSATRHESGLYYIISNEGSGDHPDLNSTITVSYKGYLTDGTVFDETTGNSSASFPLNGLIQGWKIGIPLLKNGGSGLFFIPSALGYGSQAIGEIPANSVLIFEISLIDFY
ncbi:MAG: FKBP-type peptidyl-prolyl cis-trans isomerase [Bacteroidales bacterium]|nr:FKBP-type peptidyl-prolyl cis-trans isomerase [Bacteroidales bacterium]